MTKSKEAEINRMEALRSNTIEQEVEGNELKAKLEILESHKKDLIEEQQFLGSRLLSYKD